MTPSATHSSEASEGAPSEWSDDDIMLRRRRHRKTDGGIEGLNLTAMMDIMTIILVFLIKQYESAPQNITLTDDLTPPKTTSVEEMVPGVAMVISKTSILVDNKLVVNLVKWQPVAKDGTAGWTPVAKALAARREMIEALHGHGGAAFDGNIMVIADEEIPYDVITNVLLQAGHEQFTTYRLILRAGGTK